VTPLLNLLEWTLSLLSIIFPFGYNIFDKIKYFWSAPSSLNDTQLCIHTIKVGTWQTPCLYSGGAARTGVSIIASGTQSQICHLHDFLIAGDMYLPTRQH
jgi:hypothetical protein